MAIIAYIPKHDYDTNQRLKSFCELFYQNQEDNIIINPDTHAIAFEWENFCITTAEVYHQNFASLCNRNNVFVLKTGFRINAGLRLQINEHIKRLDPNNQVHPMAHINFEEEKDFYLW